MRAIQQSSDRERETAILQRRERVILRSIDKEKESYTAEQ